MSATGNRRRASVRWLLAVALQVAVLGAALYVLHRTHLWRRLRDDEGTQEQ